MAKYAVMVVAVLFMLQACSSAKHIAGIYRSPKNANELNWLSLKPDSTFKYIHAFVDFVEHSSGTYKIKPHHQLVLNSTIQYDKMPITVVDSTMADTMNIVSIKVDIKNRTDSLSNYYCGFYVNDYPYQFGSHIWNNEKPCDSLNAIRLVGNTKSIYFAIAKRSRWTTSLSSPLVSEIYTLKKPVGNKLGITIDCDEAYFGLESFDRVVYKIKRHKIAIPLPAGSKKHWFYLYKTKDKST